MSKHIGTMFYIGWDVSTIRWSSFVFPFYTKNSHIESIIYHVWAIYTE